MKRIVGLFILAVISAVSAAAELEPFAQCRDALYGDASTFTSVGATAAEVNAFRNAYRRMTFAADLYPWPMLCVGNPNGGFSRDGGRPRLKFTVSLIQLLNGDEQLISAVIAHELGHMQLQHLETKRQVAEKLDEAIHTSEDLQDARGIMTAVTRDMESEADDWGTIIARKAGLDESVMPKALAYLGVFENPFDDSGDHPALALRIMDTQRVAKNERYHRKAVQEVSDGDVVALHNTSSAWATELPGSGSAEFYLGVSKLQSGDRHATEAFGESVGNFFGGEGMRSVAQPHFLEMTFAPVFLCVNLYRDKDKLGALHCLNALGDRNSVEVFKRLTGWKDFILLPHRNRDPRGLFADRNPTSGMVRITNCRATAALHDMRPSRLWRPTPLERAPRKVADETPMVCDRNLCRCQPISPEAQNELAQLLLQR